LPRPTQVTGPAPFPFRPRAAQTGRPSS
jgi:hypothetical protein